MSRHRSALRLKGNTAKWSRTDPKAAERHWRKAAAAEELYAALYECVATFEPLLAEVELDPQANPARVALAHAHAALALARPPEAPHG